MCVLQLHHKLIKTRSSLPGNKIHFLGVDMVNGTPVLDVKPYIPQYDYPTPAFVENMSALVRPPTEGISDAAATLAGLPLDDEAYDARRLVDQLYFYCVK